MRRSGIRMQNPPGSYFKRVAKALRAAKRKGHSLTMAEASKLLRAGRLKPDGTLSKTKKKKSTKKTTRKVTRKSTRKTTSRNLENLELHPIVLESLNKLCKLKGK